MAAQYVDTEPTYFFLVFILLLDCYTACIINMLHNVQRRDCCTVYVCLFPDNSQVHPHSGQQTPLIEAPAFAAALIHEFTQGQ